MRSISCAAVPDWRYDWAGTQEEVLAAVRLERRRDSGSNRTVSST